MQSCLKKWLLVWHDAKYMAATMRLIGSGFGSKRKRTRIAVRIGASAWVELQNSEEVVESSHNLTTVQAESGAKGWNQGQNCLQRQLQPLHGPATIT